MSKSSYSAKDFDFLEGLDPIRLRPAMYIGDTGEGGLHHIVKEVIDNAIDEHLDGHVDHIKVCVNTADQVVRVEDNGRGIPVSKHPQKKIPILTGVLTHIHGGSKFGKGAYTSAVVGLHGIGIKATNALSTWLSVYTKRRGKVWGQKFERGEPVTKVVRVKKRLKRGTVVAFSPDPKIFGKNKLKPKKILKWLRDVAYLCPGLKITFRVDGEQPVEYLSNDGLSELLLDLTSELDLLHEPLVIKNDSFDLALAWTDAEGEHWKSAVNVSPTPDHGTHVVGVKKALHTVLNEHAGKRYRGEDLRDGIVGLIHAKVLEPQFRGQTKVKLENPEVADEIQEVVSDLFRRWIAENASTAKAIIERAKQLQAAKKKFRSEQKAIKGTKVKSGAKGILPGKLIECPDASPTERELYIVEGDSALGTVVDARVERRRKGKRTYHFQEVYPIRGKMLNVARKGGLDEVMKNKEVEGLVKALGTGIGPSFNLAKARHTSVYLLTDADPDGKHIRALLTALFARFLHEMIEDGRLRYVRNPLFRGVTSSSIAYGDTIEEVQKQLKTSKCRITRFKGLGEMRAEDMGISIDPKTRKELIVGLEEDDRELVLTYMGKDSSVRKRILGITE